MTIKHAASGRMHVELPNSKVVALVIADAHSASLRVRGEVLVAHAVRGLAESGCIDRLIVVGPPGVEGLIGAVPDLPDLPDLPGLLPGSHCRVLPASATRADSIRLAFEAAGSCEVVLVHDAARAFVPPATIRAVAEAVFQGAEAVAPVLPVTDTVKLVDSADVITATEDRSQLRALQTPLGYAEDLLREACARGIDPLSSPPGKVRTVAGHPNAMRLATPFDLAVAEALLLDEQSVSGGTDDR